MNRSAYALIFCFFIMALAGNLYYPKWKKTRGEATISWDVAGYYLYLPALFIYEDVKGCGFADSLLRKYESSPYFCLLYTSPSPRDRTRSRMPSSA